MKVVVATNIVDGDAVFCVMAGREEIEGRVVGENIEDSPCFRPAQLGVPVHEPIPLVFRVGVVADVLRERQLGLLAGDEPAGQPCQTCRLVWDPQCAVDDPASSAAESELAR